MNDPSHCIARTSATPARRPVVVTGKVKCLGKSAVGTEVWVGPRRTKTDAKGRFRVKLEVGESVPVFVDLE